VTIYTKPFCPYCTRAIGLLRQKGVSYQEIEAGMDPALRQEMMQRSGRSTYPQIFIGDKHVGGCDDIMALERDGKLVTGHGADVDTLVASAKAYINALNKLDRYARRIQLTDQDEGAAVDKSGQKAAS
jgi:glutaredoxin 3